MRFVRITYQECEERDLTGTSSFDWKPVGLLQDIRLTNGYFDIVDDLSAIELDIVDGELMAPAESRAKRRAQ